MGLAVVDPAGNNGQGSLYQHPSWDDAGYLGAWTYDRDGNIYAAPVPLVSLVENPPDQQNQVYRVDSDSQAMAEWVVPARGPASLRRQPLRRGGAGLRLRHGLALRHLAGLGSTAGQEVGLISTSTWPAARWWRRWRGSTPWG